MHVDPFDRYHYALLVFHSKLGKWSRMELDLDLELISSRPLMHMCASIFNMSPYTNAHIEHKFMEVLEEFMSILR